MHHKERRKPQGLNIKRGILGNGKHQGTLLELIGENETEEVKLN